MSGTHQRKLPARRDGQETRLQALFEPCERVGFSSGWTLALSDLDHPRFGPSIVLLRIYFNGSPDNSLDRALSGQPIIDGRDGTFFIADEDARELRRLAVVLGALAPLEVPPGPLSRHSALAKADHPYPASDGPQIPSPGD